jgi:DNA-binding SARP family transcriptional activator/tetratricopeptide (TPR) repeat protein
MLHVSLLGEQAIADAATGAIRTRSSRAVALIAFLVVHAGIPQTRQRIAGLFWPDSTDAQALTNLRRELHHLRQALGDEPSLLVTSTDLCWCDTDTSQVDVRIFDIERTAALAAAACDDTEAVVRHGAAAIAQYRGELLPGTYDDWLLETRSELERECADLCMLVGDARARQGDLSGAVDAVRRRVALQPLDEVGYRTMMELQADLGDRAGAVSTYHHCASVLERELGVIPDLATRKTLQRVLAHVHPAQAAQAAVEAAPGRSGLAQASLVGRSRELAGLEDLWRTASTGRPSLALVRGGAGVGKSRLVAEVAERARLQGAVVATTQCFGTSGRLALAPVADWLRNPAVQSATATLDPAWRAEVERLMPSGTGRRDRPPVSRAMVEAWQRHRFFEGLARALIAVDRPTLLVLDNVQWCDQETLAFLTLFLGLVADARILVAGTLRDDNLDEDPEFLTWTVRMRATGLLTELSLSPLEISDTAQLAGAIAGRPLLPDDTDLLQATTGGFPLYVIEAARTAVDLGDSRLPVGDLTGVLCNRLEQATPAAREIAGLAAAVGRNFTLDLLTEASDLEADTVVRAVDELWRRRIIHELPGGYDFSHDLLRETAYAQVSPPQRWLLHRRLAQGLELLHADDMDTVCAQLAEQYAGGGRPDRAVANYRRAAEVASGMFAHTEAIRLHKEALKIVRAQTGGRDKDAQELAILEAMAAPLTARYGYSAPELQEALERTIELAERLGRKASTITGLFGLWTSRYVQGRVADGHQTVTRALSLAEPDTELSGSAHFAFAGSSVSLGRPAEALRHFEVAAKLTRDAHSWTIGTRPDVHCRAWVAHAQWLLGRDDDALTSAREAIRLARVIEHPFSLAVALAYAGITHQMRQDMSELRVTVSELRQLCERYHFGYYREWGLVLDGWSRDDDSGLELARRGIDNLKTEGSFARMPYWLALLADLLARCGRPGGARATLDAALVAGQARDEVWWLPEVIRMRAAHDEAESAISRLRSAAQLATAQGSVALLRRCQHDLAERGVPDAVHGVLHPA